MSTRTLESRAARALFRMPLVMLRFSFAWVLVWLWSVVCLIAYVVKVNPRWLTPVPPALVPLLHCPAEWVGRLILDRRNKGAGLPSADPKMMVAN